MRTREELEKQAKGLSGWMLVGRMLQIIAEILLDIRDIGTKISESKTL
jgi:hypothetical protein